MQFQVLPLCKVRLLSPAENLNELEIAYAITVHKSQGSQYDTVIMPASTDCQKMLRRNLFYTAISRAKKQVILVGSKEALHIAMVTPPEPRKSMLVIKTHQKMHFAA